MGVKMTAIVDKVPARVTGFLRGRIDPVSAIALVALCLATPLHFIGLDQPLWFDEAGTGGIAAQHSLGAVLRLTLHDVNAPGYYVFAHYWSMLCGLSNIALRLPSAIAAVAAAWIVAASGGPIDRQTKLVWAALLALWIPGFTYAQDARCYMLLFCLATMDALLFAKLLFEPERKTAVLWAIVSSLAILTHYHALLIVGAQGLILISVHRRKVLPLWPACLAFVPIPFWLGIHLATILQFLKPDTSWYWLLTLGNLPALTDFMTNSALFAGFALVLLLVNVMRRKAWADRASFDPLWLVVLSGLVPALFVVAIGFFRPSFAERYLIVFAPCIFLGLALIMRDAKAYWRAAPLALMLMFASALVAWSVKQIGAPDNPYSFERASKVLMDHGTRRLVFFWDNPNSQVLDPSMAIVVGGFFFVRAGVPVDVTPIRLKPGEDPNDRLIREAKAHDAAILWVFDRAVGGTAARSFPYDIAGREPSLACDVFGNARFGIVACRPKEHS